MPEGSRRCSICGISWPLDDEFKRCYGENCGRKTDPVSNVNPDMSMLEALSMKRHYKFERHYEKHEPQLTLTTDEREKFTLEAWKQEVAASKPKLLKPTG